jgi:hypothetical protein
VQGDHTLASLQDIFDSFSSCFTRPSFASFVTLACGWILCRERRWITRVIVASGLLGWKHHSSFYRFFSNANWKPDDLGHRLFQRLLPRLPQVVEGMVDDTLCRRAGPRIFGISMQRDGAASSYGKGGGGPVQAFACGHPWVVLSVRIPLPWNPSGCAVPVLARLYRSPKRCPAAEYKKRTQLAREMVETLVKWLPEGRTLHLTGDREYACRTVLRDLDTTVQFTGPIPKDALLYRPVPKYSGRGRPRVHGERVPSPKQRAQRGSCKWKRMSVVLYGGRCSELLVQSWTCLWYTATGQRLIRVVLTRDPKGNYEDRTFFSTEHSATPADILQRFAGRWLIEVSFRDAKQLFGLADPQNGFSRGARLKRKNAGPQPRGDRGHKAVERTARFVWMVYAIVIVWYLDEGHWQRDVQVRRKQAPWYRSKATPSFEDMLAALRTEMLVHRLHRQPLPNRTRAETRSALRRLGLAA